MNTHSEKENFTDRNSYEVKIKYKKKKLEGKRIKKELLFNVLSYRAT